MAAAWFCAQRLPCLCCCCSAWRVPLATRWSAAAPLLLRAPVSPSCLLLAALAHRCNLVITAARDSRDFSSTTNHLSLPVASRTGSWACRRLALRRNATRASCETLAAAGMRELLRTCKHWQLACSHRFQSIAATLSLQRKSTSCRVVQGCISAAPPCWCCWPAQHMHSRRQT